jgi:hypothetical protein
MKVFLLLLHRRNELLFEHRWRYSANFGEDLLFGNACCGGVLCAELTELCFSLAACVDFALADAGHGGGEEEQS